MDGGGGGAAWPMRANNAADAFRSPALMRPAKAYSAALSYSDLSKYSPAVASDRAAILGSSLGDSSAARNRRPTGTGDFTTGPLALRRSGTTLVKIQSTMRGLSWSSFAAAAAM